MAIAKVSQIKAMGFLRASGVEPYHHENEFKIIKATEAPQLYEIVEDSLKRICCEVGVDYV